MSLKIEVDKYYKTRSGKKAYIAAILKNPFGGCDVKYPYLGFFNGGDVQSWDAEGRWVAFSHNTHDYDLIEEWQEPIEFFGYVNVYPGSYTVVHPSRLEADGLSYANRIACIKVKVKFEYTKGEGL